MAKPITKTTSKYTSTHHRIAITCKFVNGEVLKLSSTYTGERLAIERPIGLAGAPTQQELRNLLNAISTFHAGENNGQRFERIAIFLETTNSIADAGQKIVAETAAQPAPAKKSA